MSNMKQHMLGLEPSFHSLTGISESLMCLSLFRLYKHHVHLQLLVPKLEFQMDFIISAILGELTTRSINFIISKISKPTALDLEDNLQKALLRAQIIADEAMGRHVTSRAMLLQLDMLKDAIHRGCYMLDIFRYQSHKEDVAKTHALGHSFALSKINSLKGLCSSSSNTQIFEQMQTSLDNLTSIIIDVKELVVFLSSYPRMYRQPYSMHLLLGNCMAGRQTEAEHVISFLLQTQPYGTEYLEVLPIVGPALVGKSTLVAHVCKDERVRTCFSEIYFLHDRDFTNDELVTFVEGCAMKHQSLLSKSNKYRKVLFVLELVGDLSEDAWNKLYSSSKRCLPRGSKIIVTSRSDQMKKLGTIGAVTLKYLSEDAYWYFFKTLAFGSMDPEMHPRLAYLAMEIARMLNKTFLTATTMACLLRDNFEIQFWRKVLLFLRGLIQKHVFRFGEHPFDLVDPNIIVRHKRMVVPFEYFVVYHLREWSSEEEVPKIRDRDIVYGTLKCSGKLELLVWKSPLPPYYTYVYTCEVQERKSMTVKRKRPMKDGVAPY
jgi:hypothetical protein